MKKTILIILVFLCVNAAGILLLPQTSPVSKKQTIYIAVAVPMTGADRVRGKEILNAIRLYLNRAKSEGLLRDKNIELLTYDDRRDLKTALKIASDLVGQNRVLLVLGHYYSSSAEIAGTLYRQRGLPAITASATSDSVTSENGWYFNVLPNNRFISAYVAEYIRRGLGYSSATLIYDDDAYGGSLARSFIKESGELNIQIKGNWSFDRDAEDLNDRLSYITAQLRAMDDPGIIYFATYPTEGIKILSGLKFPGTPNAVIGPPTFSSPSFIEDVKRYPKERIIPGYYSDGVYSVSPFLASMAGEEGRRFREAYYDAFNAEPSWLAAGYYDAIQVAVRAIENAEISGGDIQEVRRRVREAIGDIDSMRVAVQGATGSIYFDENGNSQRPLTVGIYDRHLIYPWFLQFEHLSDIDEKSAITEEIADKIVIIDGKVLAKMQLVYAGIHMIEVRNLDVEQNTFTADFLIWFRYQGKFNAKQIRFTDAISSIVLDKPLIEHKKGDITLRAYRVKANFNSTFDYRKYPFDRQTLSVRFHHQFMTRKKLIFVPDVSGLPGKMPESYLTRHLGHALSGWHVKSISVYQDTAKIKRRTSKYEIDFSRYNVAIRIDRDKWSLVTTVFVPTAVMFIVLYAVYWLPSDRIRSRTYLIVAVLIANIIYHMSYLSVFSRGHVDAAVFSVYGLTGVAAVMTGFVHFLSRRERTRPVRLFMTAGKIGHPILVLTVGCWISYLYMS